jgi:hypothetical protein
MDLPMCSGLMPSSRLTIWPCCNPRMVNRR